MTTYGWVLLGVAIEEDDLDQDRLDKLVRDGQFDIETDKVQFYGEDGADVTLTEATNYYDALKDLADKAGFIVTRKS